MSIGVEKTFEKSRVSLERYCKLKDEVYSTAIIHKALSGLRPWTLKLSLAKTVSGIFHIQAAILPGSFDIHHLSLWNALLDKQPYLTETITWSKSSSNRWLHVW